MNDKYEVVIGLEIHAELNTNTKVFCGCKNEFGQEVNTLCCPICMGFPGTLPTLNKKVVEYAALMGLALDCDINNITKQDRKNYFYPDLPKAYQISQNDIPLCVNGQLEILVDGQLKTIGVTRIHIEEDAGKLIHSDSFEGTLIDLNRAGVPLIEIVSEPDLRSANEAKTYLEAVHSILLYLGISDAKMQEGSVRCDVNVSVREKGCNELGNRVEMKNVNSFGGVYRGISYEADRQIKAVENGEIIAQETRRWDDAKGASVLLRTKEDAQDYRYFPEPDLLPYEISADCINRLKASLPELPLSKVKRYIQDYSLPVDDAVLHSQNKYRSAFFDQAAVLNKVQPKLISNWIISDIAKYLNENRLEINDINLTPAALCSLIEHIESGEISNTAAKAVLLEMITAGASAKEIIQRDGLSQINDDAALTKLVNEVIEKNSNVVQDYKNGKTNAIGFLVGQCMKNSGGKGNPASLKEILLTIINK